MRVLKFNMEIKKSNTKAIFSFFKTKNKKNKIFELFITLIKNQYFFEELMMI